MNDISVSVIDGVQITDDGEVMHFTPVDNCQQTEQKAEEPVGFWKKIASWCIENIIPYAKLRNLSDPLKKQTDSLEGGKLGAEIGIKVSF